ncbi:MAG: hypothetical protein K2O24_00460 [Muribaculaceae bacterium]|nr:hypothetical protein [Muribaculaceae bacterium]
MTFLKNDEDAEDALQDTFFNLWKADSVKSEPEARNKLFAVLKNVCIDRLRRPRTLGMDDVSTDNFEVAPVLISET